MLLFGDIKIRRIPILIVGRCATGIPIEIQIDRRVRTRESIQCRQSRQRNRRRRTGLSWTLRRENVGRQRIVAKSICVRMAGKLLRVCRGLNDEPGDRVHRRQLRKSVKKPPAFQGLDTPNQIGPPP